MSKKIKAAGYIRVSSSKQVEGESLSTQQKSIKEYCKQNKYQLTEIYADEGISGGTVKERHALLKALHDAQNGKFDILVIHRLSRFGRNARELLNNHEDLKKEGIKLRSIKEGIDFDNAYGKAMLTMLAAVAELEREIINEQMRENQIAISKRGIPSSGRLPFGRTFDKETKEWGIIKDKKDAIQWVYEEYVKKDRSLQQIAIDIEHRFNFSITYQYLVTVLKERCGTEWTINYEGEEPITYKIPRLLSDDKIQQVKDRLEHNRTNNRTDIQNKYLLTGFLRCRHCGKSLYGQTQKKNGKVYQYYVHPNGKAETCNEFGSVSLPRIESLVFGAIFEHIWDVPSFEKAIEGNLADTDDIRELEHKIDRDEKALKKVQGKLDNLIEAVADGALEMDDIREKSDELKGTKARLEDEINEAQNRLDNRPDREELLKEAGTIRLELMEQYSSPEHLKEMTFEEKKRLLHWLFDGSDINDVPYGIYIDKEGSRNDSFISFTLHGRLTNQRVVEKDDDKDNGSGGDSSPAKGQSSHGKTDYKTNNFSVAKNEPKSHWGY